MPGPSSETSSRAPPSAAATARTAIAALGRRVPHRVLDEVRDDLVQTFGVGVEPEVARDDLDLEVHVGGVQLRLADRVLEHRPHLERVAVERQRARLEAGEVEELLHQPAEPLDLGEHRAQRLRVGLADAVDEVLEHGLQRGDRRAQLVADVGDEVAAQPVGLGELGRHLVERARERADLVVRHRRRPGPRSRPAPSPRWPRPSRAAAT